MPTILSRNEWDPLKTVIVGSATGANWPTDDPVFSQESLHTQWTKTPVPSGAVPQWVIDECNEDLEVFADTLIKLGVTVHRPNDNDFVLSQGMYNYCLRDRLLIADDIVIDVAMLYPCRDQEIEYIREFVDTADIMSMPRDQGLVLDAANVLRLGDDWLFLLSRSGNDNAMAWLQQQFPRKNIHPCEFYQGVHIDSTIAALREGTVLLNASRVNADNLPKILDSWDKIWVESCVERDFYQYPYASSWIGMNCFSVDPTTVIVDRLQTDLIRQLERKKFTVIPLELRHCRTLGGGFHCVTLDLWRDHA